MTTSIGDKVDRERTRRVLKHASHNQKDHGNWADGVTLKPSHKTKAFQTWNSDDFRNFDHVKSYIEGRAKKEGGSWAFSSVFGFVDIVRADSPSKIPDDYVSLSGSNNKHYTNGKWREFSEAKKIREQNRGLILKHKGPGDHPSGTPQSTHGRGGRKSSTKDIKEATERQGGLTIRTMSGERPERGFSVAIPGHEREIPRPEVSREEIGLYIRDNWSTLQPKGFFLGTWKNTAKNIVVLDVAKVMDAKDYTQAFDAAVKFGRGHGEAAIYDLLNFEEIALDDESVAAYREGLTS